MMKSNPSFLLAAHLMCVALVSTSGFVLLPHRGHSHATILLAKKKGNKKNKQQQQQKKGGFEWASSFTLQPYDAKEAREYASTAVASFRGRANKHLCKELEEASDIPKALWKAPIACVVVGESNSKGKADADDDGSAATVVVQYANIAALETVGLKPNEFEQLFSTAPPKDDGEASSFAVSLALLPVMKGDKKFEREYTKKIIKQDTGDVTILDAYRWELEKSQLIDGKFVTQSFGVAYAWSEWMVGEMLLCRPGGIQETVMEEQNYDELIAQQGTFIRDLKENQGMSNKDPKVGEAVAELLRLKKLQGAQELSS